MVRCIALLLIFAFAIAAQPPQVAWLDAPLKPWNRAGASVPRAQKIYHDLDEIPKMCRTRLRQPATPEEREVERRGWMLFGVSRDNRGIVVVEAMANMDGMCRPDFYQYFVFVNGVYAGTMSPKPMNARSDSSAVSISFPAPSSIATEFLRYTEKDPLCCPSRISETAFEVSMQGNKPVVSAARVRTRLADR